MRKTPGSVDKFERYNEIARRDSDGYVYHGFVVRFSALSNAWLVTHADGFKYAPQPTREAAHSMIDEIA